MSFKNIVFLPLLSSVLFSSCQHAPVVVRTDENSGTDDEYNPNKIQTEDKKLSPQQKQPFVFSLIHSDNLKKRVEQALEQSSLRNEVMEVKMVENFGCDDECDPNVTQAEEKIKKLSSQQKQQLASSIIHSCNWEKMLEQALEEIRNGRKDELLSVWHLHNNSYMKRVIIPNIRPSIKDKDILSLLRNNKDGELILGLIDIFDFVVEHYIEHFPDDKNGWDFLWLFSGEPINRPELRASILELLKDRQLDRFYYGKKMLKMFDNSSEMNFGRFL